MKKIAKTHIELKAEEYNWSKQAETEITDVEIIGDINVVTYKSKLTFISCRFSRLNIKSNIHEVNIQDCCFDELTIENGITELNVKGTKTSKAKITINSPIEKIKLFDNKKFETISIKNGESKPIESFICANTIVKDLNINGTIRQVMFSGYNKINSILLNGLFYLITFDHNKLSDDEKDNSYGSIRIENSRENNTLRISSIKVSAFYIYNSSTYMSVYVNALSCEDFYFQQIKLIGDGFIEFAECKDVSNIIIREAKLSQLQFFNSDFSHSHFILEKCQVGKIDWQFVNWAKSIGYYIFNQDENEYVSETLRILKLNAIHNEDKINTNLFSSLENEAIRRKLKKEKSSLGDKLILWLNFISNNHGLNPWRSICFTLIVCAIFFLPSLYFLNKPIWEWGWTNWSDFWIVSGKIIEFYSKSLYAAHSFDYMSEFEPQSIFFIFDFIGRIFIAYGYYQTVVAFRKFNRK